MTSFDRRADVGGGFRVWLCAKIPFALDGTLVALGALTTIPLALQLLNEDE